MPLGGPLLFGCQQEHTSIVVPIVFTAYGVLMWFIGGRQMIRDPRQTRAIAEARARSRILHPRGGGDVGVTVADKDPAGLGFEDPVW
jgi:hypothetical protein